MDKKYWIGIVSTVVIVPSLIFGWKNIQSIWAAPEDIKKVDAKVDTVIVAQKEQALALQKVSENVKDISYRQDKSEAVNTMQIAALKELMQEMKRK